MVARTKKLRPYEFTREQARTEHDRLMDAAMQKGGAIVVDEEGRRILTIRVPQDTIDISD